MVYSILWYFTLVITTHLKIDVIFLQLVQFNIQLTHIRNYVATICNFFVKLLIICVVYWCLPLFWGKLFGHSSFYYQLVLPKSMTLDYYAKPSFACFNCLGLVWQKTQEPLTQDSLKLHDYLHPSKDNSSRSYFKASNA